MRKPLTACFSTCLLVSSLIGCAGESAEQLTADKLDELIEQMDRLRYSAAPVDANSRTYTNGVTVGGEGGIKLAGSYTQDALYLDQALTLVPLAEEIAKTGNKRQKQSANTILASILADDGAFLTNAAGDALQSASSQIGPLRDRADMAKAILEYNKALAGDGAVVIDTLQTGDIGNGNRVDGIQQLKEQVADATRQLDAANAALQSAKTEIGDQNDKVAEFESIDLQLKSEARSASNEVKFEKLDKSTTALKEAETAEARSLSLQTDVEIAQGNATLAEGRKARGQAVIDELEAKVEKIRQERAMVAGKLAELERDRQATLTALTASYNEMDSSLQAGGFDRMGQASERLTQAADALIAAGLGPGSDLQLMSIYTLHARSLQQQALAARSYAAMLGTLSANGPEVLGSGLHQAITARIAELGEFEAVVRDAAAALDEKAAPTVASIEEQVGEETRAGRAAGDNVRLYRSLLGDAR